jgi:hypothetical protein
MDDKQNLIGPLARWLAAGKLEARFVLPAIEKLAGDGSQPGSFLALIEALDRDRDKTLVSLARSMRETLRQEALRVHESRRRGRTVANLDDSLLTGLPQNPAEDWTLAADPTAMVESVLRQVRDLDFAASNQDKAPRLLQQVKQQVSAALPQAHNSLAPLFKRVSPALWEQLQDAWPVDWPGRHAVLIELRERMITPRSAALAEAKRSPMDPSQIDDRTLDDGTVLAGLETRFATAQTTEEKAHILDALCSWPTPALFASLRTVAEEAWAQDRALLNLVLRFGQPDLKSWEDWRHWQLEQERLWRLEQELLQRLIRNHAPGLLLILYSQTPDPDPATLAALVKMTAESIGSLNPSAFVQSWSAFISSEERLALLGVPKPAPDLVAPPIISDRGREAAGGGQAPPLLPPSLRPERVGALIDESLAGGPEPATAPAPPSVWEQHIQPFIVENWYIVAGIAMVILGSSLLAYYTWDKHWLVRYTIMPSLLALFTWALAGVGTWIEKRGGEFKSTAAIMRGAAIGLLPINFMAMALLSADEKVPQKGPALLAMALVYLSLFGWGLRRWCAAVEPALGKLLGGTLLFLNALVAVGPLARTVGHLQGDSLLLCLGAGFYLGFTVTAGAIVRFSRHILTKEMAEERRVPWFVGGVLAITFLQVFIWVHGFMRHVPQAHTYALLVIFTGWLILHSERRALELLQSPQLHGGESFLGFALLLLGVIMGFGQPSVRIASFVAAGGVWMYQAMSRRHPLHYWIALTLWAVGVASVGLLPRYPGPWLPLLGLLLALGFGLGAWASQRREQEQLAQACRGMQVVALVLATVAAPLVQWHYQSAPLATAGWLLAAAALLAWRSVRDQKIHWLHATMLVLALILPYAGFVDLVHRTAHHNTLVFGLALLSYFWLAMTWLRPSPLLLQARSSVLWFYGALAVAAMLLRVALGDTAPDPLWFRDYMDYLGPILIMIALIPATFYSRSLVPAAMAVTIMAILFPELKANLRLTIPGLAWGSGLGSAVCGLVLTGLCFFLREWPYLRNLPEGDRFLDRDLFPFRRYDHTLFTWPILAAVLFLLVKVETWNVLQNLVANGLRFKTAIALGVTGIVWTCLAIYHRQQRGAVLGVHLGWFWMLAAIGSGYWQQVTDPNWTWPFLVMGLLLQGLYLVCRFQLEPKHPWVKDLLTDPIWRVLLVGSAALIMASIICLLEGASLERMQWLYLFLAAQLVWHAQRTRQPFFGVLLFIQIWLGLLVLAAPGPGPLWERASLERSLSPTLWLLTGVQFLFVALEKARWIRQRLAPLLTPAFLIATGLGWLLGVASIVDGVHWLALSRTQQTLSLFLLLLGARAHASGSFLLPAMLLGYVMIHRDLLASTADLELQLALLATPWRVALLGLGMVLLMQAGRWIRRQPGGLLAGPFAHPFFTAPSCGWIFGPAMVISAAAVLYQTFHPVLRESPAQLWAPYIAAMTFALVAWFWDQSRLFAGAGLLLTVGNIHLVRVFAGELLRGRGLSEPHLICLGLGLSLLQGSVLRRWVRSTRALAAINLASLALAGGILVLLSANYFTEPNLAGITSTRFIVSGMLAWLAGCYFRRAARQPGPGEEGQTDLCEALYHFGLVLALWCAALLVPWFRQPMFALIALGIPAVYFTVRAELGMRRGLPEFRRYRNSAAVIGFMLLGLYVCKGLFHLVLFPGTPIGTQYYHYNAPVILLLGLLLLRLHGLGGTTWLAVYGGLALMTGSYFLLTALPGLSPFDFPMPSAWCALGLGHFWILLSYARSPLRTQIQRLANLDDASWHGLRRAWGRCLLAATQAAMCWGLADYSSDTYMVAPLLVGGASILVHQGIIRQSPSYLIIGALEVALALHMDFLIPSYLPREQVVWVLLLIWACALSASDFLKLELRTTGRISLALTATVLAHVAYHRPWSVIGLWVTALGALLCACTPQRDRRPSHDMERVCGALLLWVPTWLVYFSQTPFESRGMQAGLEAWPILATAATLFLTGLLARAFPAYYAASYQSWPRARFRLFDSTVAWLESAGGQIYHGVLWVVLASALAIQVTHYQALFTSRELVLLVLLEAASAVAWFYQGKTMPSMVPYYLMQLSAVALFVTIRRQLMLSTQAWNYEYDVWASLVFSSALTGAKQLFENQPRAARVPLLTFMFALPVIALVWVLVHGLGVNMALSVVGLQSVMFAYLGKGDRESPYNLVALAGFVAFILMTFYAKLHLRMVHAYIIPVGLCVLVLQELFRNRIKPGSGNWIRLLTLMAMLGSTGYYALAGSQHTITLNLTMIVLCLLAMGLGSLLRIRLYLALGLAGLMTDLVSLLYKVLVQMERSTRMTVIGTLVLTIGAILVFGAIYYKTNKATVDALTGRWRGRLTQWQ